MTRFSLNRIAMIAVLPILQALNPASAQSADPCVGMKDWSFVIRGQPADVYLAENTIDSLVRELDFDISRSELARILVSFRDDPQRVYPGIPGQLQGVDGFIVASLLQTLLDENGDPVTSGGNPIADTVLSGKIRDYTLVKGPQNTGSGHISVDMCYRDDASKKKYFLHWDMAVGDDNFTISETTNTPRPPLDHKLEAKGVSVEVRHVYFRDVTGTGTALTRLNSGHRHYQRTNDNCVDLFTEGVPPETYGELVAADFCLGRCDNPRIVNTGD